MFKKAINWTKARVTPAVFIVVLINLFIALLFTLIQFLTSNELQFTFSTYPTYSEYFHVYQLFTFMFVHSTDLMHVIMNVFFIVMFAPFMVRILGSSKFILAYFLMAWMGFLFINYSYHQNKYIIEKNILSEGIHPSQISLDNDHSVSIDYLSRLTPKKQTIVREYNHVTSKTNGASGALYGIIIFYLALNCLNHRKIIYLLFGVYLVSGNIYEFFLMAPLRNGSVYAHLGGMFGGILVVIWFLWNKKRQSH